MLLPSNFDASKPLVAARFFPAHEIEFEPGHPVEVAELGAEREKGQIEYEIALRLWMVGYLIYADAYLPMPIESAQSEAERLVKMEDIGGGWFLLTTPWGGEGEKVQGEEAATARRAAIIAKGDTKGVVITDNGDGTFTISAPWLDEPKTATSAEEASVEETMLIQDGPPAGWVPESADDKAARLKAAADAAAKAEADAAAAEEAAKREAILSDAGVTVTAKGANWYDIEAAWLDATVKVQGRAAADARADEVLASKPADEAKELEPVEGDAASVLISVGDSDWTVTAPWLDAPEVFATVEAAEARQAELRAAGAPEGWVAPKGEDAATGATGTAEQPETPAQADQVSDTADQQAATDKPEGE